MPTMLTRVWGYTISQASQSFTHGFSYTSVNVNFMISNSFGGAYAVVGRALNSVLLRAQVDGTVGDLMVERIHSIQGGD